MRLLLKDYTARPAGRGYSPRSSHKAHCRTEMMGLIGAGNNPMVGMTVAVAIEEASK